MASDWEEITLMMEVSDSGHIESRRPGESYFQILGLSSEKPLVKVNNQLYKGQFVDTLGSQLFLEVENKAGQSATETGVKISKDVIVSDKCLKLEPVYLELKKDTDSSHVENIQSNSANTDNSGKM